MSETGRNEAMTDIDGIRKRADYWGDTPDFGRWDDNDSEQACDDRRDLLGEVDRLSDRLKRALKSRDENNEICERYRAEVEKLRAAGRDMITSMLTGVRIIEPVTPQDEKGIAASKRFCALIGAEMFREQHEEIQRLRAQLTAALAQDEAQRRKAIYDYLDQHPDAVTRQLSDVTGELEKELGEARALIERFKAAAMLDVNGDPEKVTPELAERHVTALQTEVETQSMALDEAHAAIWGLLCAAAEAQEQAKLWEDSSQEHAQLAEEKDSLISQCRPVLEAVRAYREAETESIAEDVALRSICALELPTLPEKP